MANSKETKYLFQFQIKNNLVSETYVFRFENLLQVKNIDLISESSLVYCFLL